MNNGVNMLNKLIEVLKAYSSQLNLISTGDRERLGDKHIPDCLEFFNIHEDVSGMKIADLGTGGGLPGLVLAQQAPDAEFTLIDSRQKKLEAIGSMAEELEIMNINLDSGRFEELAHQEKHRDTYDIVVARAVAPLPVLLEYTVGFIKEGGELLAWKGTNYKEELSAAKAAMELLDLDLEKEHHYTLPSGEERVILQFRKMGPTPDKYPRTTGKPKKNPL